MKLTTGVWLTCATLTLALPAQTIAQNLPVPQNSATTSVMPTGFDHPVAVADLKDYRGGTQQAFNDMHLAGTTAGNSATDVQTGTNSISAGAFSNMSGLPIVIQNSGANVLIQNAVILNLQMN